MNQNQRGGDPLSKGFGMLVALGALGVGAVAAFMNGERTRQMRDDLERQIQDLSTRVDQSLAERRPEIESAIQRSRQVAIESLEKARGVVEQSADKAQDYVQRASTQASSVASDAGNKLQEGMSDAQQVVQDAASEAGAAEFSGGDNPAMGQETRRLDPESSTDGPSSNASL